MAISLLNAGPSTVVAEPTDLPYAMIEPGVWKFSGSGYDATKTYEVIVVEDPISGFSYSLYEDDEPVAEVVNESEDLLVVEFSSANVTATRPSLPGQLLDRANNLVDATTGDVTLTLPAYQEGKVRDLLVRVLLGDDGTNPYTITFVFPSGESNTDFVVEGDDASTAALPAPTSAGTWWYSFTECQPHKIAVSLKQLQTATAQGGS